VNRRPLRRAWSWTLRLNREIQEDGAVDAAASVAFWLILSIPAAALAIIASLSMLDPDLVAELERSLLEFIDRTFTSESTTLRNAVTGLFDQPRTGLFSVSLLLALVTLSRGFAGLIRGLDTVYDVEESRGFIRLRLASIGLALGTLLTVAASTYLWSLSGREGLPFVLRLLGAVLVLVLWAATVFHVGPNHHTPWRYDLPGAIATAIGWFVVSVGFGWYVQIASRGNEIVGSIGALLLGLTWLWIVCLILMIGGEINEMIADDADVIGRNHRWSTRAKRAYESFRSEESAPNRLDSP
jgi:membrane protein